MSSSETRTCAIVGCVNGWYWHNGEYHKCYDASHAAPATPSTGRERETVTPIRRVAQEDPMGCGVACLAMVSGRTYADVRAGINPAQVEHGLADQTILWWLNRNGIYSRRSWMDGDWSFPVPTRGVALMLTHDAHWVMLVDGVVLDPARETPLPRYDFRQAIEVRSTPLSRITGQPLAQADVDALYEMLDEATTKLEGTRRWLSTVETHAKALESATPTPSPTPDAGATDLREAIDAQVSLVSNLWPRLNPSQSVAIREGWDRVYAALTSQSAINPAQTDSALREHYAVIDNALGVVIDQEHTHRRSLEFLTGNSLAPSAKASLDMVDAYLVVLEAARVALRAALGAEPTEGGA